MISPQGVRGKSVYTVWSVYFEFPIYKLLLSETINHFLKPSVTYNYTMQIVSLM